jgi:hypothetical protein
MPPSGDSRDRGPRPTTGREEETEAPARDAERPDGAVAPLERLDAFADEVGRRSLRLLLERPDRKAS